MNIGFDRRQDVAGGFRISEGGIILVTKDMMDKLNEDGKLAGVSVKR